MLAIRIDGIEKGLLYYIQGMGNKNSNRNEKGPVENSTDPF
jgi:hypothetical protein